jgi:hypothetical protein
MKTLSKQIEESIIDGINTYKELAAIGRGFDISAFAKMCAEQIERDIDRKCIHCHKSKSARHFI